MSTTTCATIPETAYLALSHAAEQMGRHNWAKLPEADKTRATRHRRAHLPARWPTPAHAEVTTMMLDVMSGDATPEDAMALLWRSDVEAERFGR